MIREIFDNFKDRLDADRASAHYLNIGASWHSLVQTARQTVPVRFRLNDRTSTKVRACGKPRGLSLRRKREQRSLCRQVCSPFSSNLYPNSSFYPVRYDFYAKTQSTDESDLVDGFGRTKMMDLKSVPIRHLYIDGFEPNQLINLIEIFADPTTISLLFRFVSITVATARIVSGDTR